MHADGEVASGNSLYVPPWHGVGAAEPSMQYIPGGQGNAVPFFEPLGQKYPSKQGPEQAEVSSPGIPPNVPPGHGFTILLTQKKPIGQATSDRDAVPDTEILGDLELFDDEDGETDVERE